MTRKAVTAALQRYEAALRAVGAPVVANLRPGISSTEIRGLEIRFGLVLPDDVRAVWEWHDGVEGARGANSADATRMLVPHRSFGNLAWSLEFAHTFITTITDTNPGSDYAGRAFVSLLIDNVGLLINLTRGEAPLTYVNDPMSWALSDYPAMPIAERIDWWTWAVTTGVWTVAESGGWHVDIDRYPRGRSRNALL